MSGWWSDTRHAWRHLRRAPGFAVIVLITLALGIGANVTIFSVVHGVLLQPLPFAGADRLVVLCSDHPSVAAFCIASPPDVEDWREQSRSLEALGLAREWPFILAGEDGAEALSGGIGTPGFFDALSVRPLLGRPIRNEDLDPGAEPVVLLSAELWQRRFGADPDIVGRRIALDGESRTVIGVMPAGLQVPQLEGRDVWAPLHFHPRDENRRAWRGFFAYGRRAPGASLEQVRDELSAIAARLSDRYPATNEGWGIEVRDLQEYVVRGVRPALLVFLGAVGLLMLIGCANVANLMLARVTGRHGEFAIRAALGASRAQLVRLQLSEALLLAICGGGLGILLSHVLRNAYVALAPSQVPGLETAGLHGPVLLFAIVISLVAGALSGLTPALIGSRHDLAHAIKVDAGRGSSRSRSRARSLLVTVEVAMAMILLVGAGLLGKSFLTLMSWDPGFERDRLAAMWLLASTGDYPRGDAVAALFDRVVDEVSTVPGIEAVGAASAGPVFGGVETGELTIDGQSEPGPGERPVARWFDVGPGYFATLGIAPVVGREFTSVDRRGSPAVAIVNQTMARRFWPGEDPLGRSVTIEGRSRAIVGVIPDIPPLRPDAPTQPEIYWPYAQSPRWATWLVVRTGVDPGSTFAAIRSRIAAVDPDLVVARPATFDRLVSRRTSRPQFNLSLLAGFAGLALALAVVGVYGVLAWSIAERRREIGIRIALGADTRRILVAAMGQGLRPVFVGLLLGALGALALARFLTAMLHGVAPTDPTTLLAVGLLLTLVSAASCWWPAWRAARIDPLVALRDD